IDRLNLLRRHIKRMSSGTVTKKGRKTLYAVIVAVIVIAGAIGAAYWYTRPTTKTIYFYTWWATGGKVALNHTIVAFEASHPGFKVEPMLKPGAAGLNARGAILALMKAGTPPNTFQSLSGPQILSYVEAAPQGASSFVNMTPVAQSMGITRAAFPEVLQALEFNGTAFSLPITLHESGILYFNPQVLKKYNLPIPVNYALLVYDVKALEKAGEPAFMIPGADGGYDQLELWDSLFLMNGNATIYNELTYGTLNLNNPVIQQIINVTNDEFCFLVNNSYTGETSMAWTQGLAGIIKGTAVFQVDVNSMTNYAYDFLDTVTYPVNSTYVNMQTGQLLPAADNITLMSEVFPGTTQYFILCQDTIAVPSGKVSTLGLNFAKYISSWAGNTVFTKWKAATFYNNVTSDYFNTPDQWASYLHAKSLASTPSNWVIGYDVGGLFADGQTTMESGILALQGKPTPSGIAAWNTVLKQVDQEEYSDWMAAKSLGFGFMGTLSSPFGGYLPPWVT
ncbi:MAG: glucose ABC transporter substrate-binding protein GlcS, partial [Thermoprotei archaeon]